MIYVNLYANVSAICKRVCVRVRLILLMKCEIQIECSILTTNKIHVELQCIYSINWIIFIEFRDRLDFAIFL